MGKLIVVAGSQYGSEAKGHVADQLLRPERVGEDQGVVAVRVAGPNAGHTVYGACPPTCPHKDLPVRSTTVKDESGHLSPSGDWLGHPWRLRTLPVAAVSNPKARLFIADGSEVDIDVLNSELDQLEAAGYDVKSRLRVSSEATVLTKDHIEEEVANEMSRRLGSTAKGIGAARADRIWRTAELYDGFRVTHHMPEILYSALESDYVVLIEGTQGYGLGLHAGNYPYCTSSDCRAIDFLAMAGISPWHPAVTDFEVWLATRVRPIRVAGNSGPMKGETSWQELGLPEERTTVTQKVRRVGEWDPALVRRAIQANGGDHPDAPVKLALTMVDSMFPDMAGRTRWPDREEVYLREELNRYLHEREDELGCSIEFLGTGPNTGIFREGI